MTGYNGSSYNNYSVGNRASDESNRLYDRKQQEFKNQMYFNVSSAGRERILMHNEINKLNMDLKSILPNEL